MRWSELAAKEIINLQDGARLGRTGEADLLFDPASGSISAILLRGRGGLARFLGLGGHATVPWQAVRRVGPEVVIIELVDGHNAIRAAR